MDHRQWSWISGREMSLDHSGPWMGHGTVYGALLRGSVVLRAYSLREIRPGRWCRPLSLIGSRLVQRPTVFGDSCEGESVLKKYDLSI